MKRIRRWGRMISGVLSVLFCLLITFNLLSAGKRWLTGDGYATVAGFTTAIVVSGSMEPTICVDDLLIIHQQREYTEQDIITYLSQSGNLITHRIVAVSAEGYTTKGDANNTEDPESPIIAEQVVGRVIFRIPRIGCVLTYLRTPLGTFGILILGFFLLVGPRMYELRQAGGHPNNEDES